MSKHYNVLRLGFLFCLSLSIFSCNPGDQIEVPSKSNLLSQTFEKIDLAILEANFSALGTVNDQQRNLLKSVNDEKNKLHPLLTDSEFIATLAASSPEVKKMLDDKQRSLCLAVLRYLNSFTEAEAKLALGDNYDEVSATEYRLLTFVPGKIVTFSDRFIDKILRLNLEGPANYNVSEYTESALTTGISIAGLHDVFTNKKGPLDVLDSGEIAAIMERQFFLDEKRKLLRAFMHSSNDEQQNKLSSILPGLIRKFDTTKKDYEKLREHVVYIKGTKEAKDQIDNALKEVKNAMKVFDEEKFLASGSNLDKMSFEDLLKRLDRQEKVDDLKEANANYEALKEVMVIKMNAFDFKEKVDAAEKRFNELKTNFTKSSPSPEEILEAKSIEGKVRQSLLDVKGDVEDADWLGAAKNQAQLEGNINEFRVFLGRLLARKGIRKVVDDLEESLKEAKDLRKPAATVVPEAETGSGADCSSCSATTAT